MSNLGPRNGTCTTGQCCGSGSGIRDAVLRIRSYFFPDPQIFPYDPQILYQYCWSGMFIPHPGAKFFHPKKWFPSSGKYDPDCSSRIRILTFYPSRNQGSKRHRILDPGSATLSLIMIYGSECRPWRQIYYESGRIQILPALYLFWGIFKKFWFNTSINCMI